MLILWCNFCRHYIRTYFDRALYCRDRSFFQILVLHDLTWWYCMMSDDFSWYEAACSATWSLRQRLNFEVWGNAVGKECHEVQSRADYQWNMDLRLGCQSLGQWQCPLSLCTKRRRDSHTTVGGDSRLFTIRCVWDGNLLRALWLWTSRRFTVVNCWVIFSQWRGTQNGRFVARQCIVMSAGPGCSCLG